MRNIKWNVVLLQFLPHFKAYALQFCDQYSLDKRYIFELQWPCRLFGYRFLVVWYTLDEEIISTNLSSFWCPGISSLFLVACYCSSVRNICLCNCLLPTPLNKPFSTQFYKTTVADLFLIFKFFSGIQIFVMMPEFERVLFCFRILP